MPPRATPAKLRPQQLDALLRDVLDALIVTDPDGNVLFMNSAAHELYGFKHLEAHQRERLNLQHYVQEAFTITTAEGKDLPDEEQPLTRALRGQPYKDVELRIRHEESSEERVFAFSGTRLDGDPPLGVLTVRDVTERSQAERRYRISFETNPAPTLIARLDDAVLVDANEGFTEMTGLSKEQADGRSLEDLGLLEDQDDLQRVLDDLREGRRPPRQQTTIGHTGGKGRNVMMSARPIEIEGRACGIFTFLDITELLQTRKRAERRTAELEEVNRELDAFSYSVAHDLRTPLRGIDGFSEALLEEHGEMLDASGRLYLERVRAGAQRMGKLIDALLTISRLSRKEVNIVPVDLSAATREILEGLAEGAPDRRVDIEVASDLMVRGDRHLLRDMMTRLLENAWKFTRHTQGACIEVGWEVDRRGGQPVMFVRDNGAGFDPRYASRLFVPFGRLHGPGQFEGEGVGLATVQRIVHRHGGQVWAEGAVGEGATFYLTLPDGAPA